MKKFIYLYGAKALTYFLHGKCSHLVVECRKFYDELISERLNFSRVLVIGRGLLLILISKVSYNLTTKSKLQYHAFFLIKSHHRSRGVPKLILYYEEDLHFGRNVPDRHCDSFSPEL